MMDFRPALPQPAAATIRENWQRVSEQVAQAAEQTGRPAESVRIVGVTKYVEAPIAACLLAAGCCDLGENRPQQLWDKADWLQEHCSEPDAVRWHLIGHLQRNKIRRTAPLLHLLQSVDSPRLARSLQEYAQSANASLDVLLEVNVTGDEAKTGMLPEAARSTLEQTLESPSIRVCGLMAMAGLEADDAQVRQQFATVRQLRDDWQAEYNVQLPELSMGMSGDFAAAIAEGATIVRIGTRLFAE